MLLDGMAVLAAILIAFSLDAWWEERADEIRTSALLEALEAEWVGDLGRIDTTLADIDAYITILSLRVNASHKDFDSISNEEIELAYTPPWSDFFRPSTGAVEAILAGGLGQIQDIQLSLAIASWPRVLSELDDRRQYVLPIVQTESQAFYSQVIQNYRIRLNPETGAYVVDTPEQKQAMDRAIYTDPDRAVLWIRAVRAFRLYRSTLVRLRVELESRLEVLKSNLATG